VMTRHARAVEEDRDEEAALHLAPAEDDDVPEAAHSGGAPRAPRAEHTSDVDQPRDAPAAADDGAKLRPHVGKHRLDYCERRTLPCIHGLMYGSQTNQDDIGSFLGLEKHQESVSQRRNCQLWDAQFSVLQLRQLMQVVLHNWTHTASLFVLQRSRWIWTPPPPPPPLRTPRPPVRPPTRSLRTAPATPPAPLLSRRRRSAAAAPSRADQRPRHLRCVSRIMLRAWGGVEMCSP